MAVVSDAQVCAALHDELAAAGVAGFLHALDLSTGRELGISADEAVVLASVFKVPVAVELVCQIDAATIRATERVRVPGGTRTAGGTGLSVLRDDVEVSIRDLAQLMISVSDNTATDVVLGRVGVERVNARMRRLGLERTVIGGDCAWLLGRLVADLGLSDDERGRLGSDEEALIRAVPVERWQRCRDLQAQHTTRSTPREMTCLLAMIWDDTAASPEGCAFVRRIMGEQVWPHRLRAGFDGAVRVSAKTGTLPFIRNEAGVVEHPDGGRYAVAVFTVAAEPTLISPDHDRLIGTVGRRLVDALRASPPR